MDRPIDSAMKAKAQPDKGWPEQFNVKKAPDTMVGRPELKGYKYDLTGNAADCVTRYLELSGLKHSDLKNVPTPCLDDTQIPEEDFLTAGLLSLNCSKIELKCLWIARPTRPDIYWTVKHLARPVSKWNRACYKRLYS